MIAACMGAGSMAAAAGAAPSVPEPSGYRLDAYRSPVPETLAGATPVDTAAAESLWRRKAALFVDVMPRQLRPPNLPAGTVWHDKERRGIPGSTWLPNVGYGDLSDDADRYFRDGLASVSGGDKHKPLLFYCLANCWMSWNAARRAMAYGYTHVIWYREGTDGWEAAGLPLEVHLPAGTEPY